MLRDPLSLWERARVRAAEGRGDLQVPE